MKSSKEKTLLGHPLLDLIDAQNDSRYIDSDRRAANPTRWEAAAQVPRSDFPGSSVSRQLDDARLTGLQKAVFDLMKDGVWRTHSEIKFAIRRGSENGISAMLRNLRSPKRGSHTVDKRRRGDPKIGLWEYRLIVKGEDDVS